MRCDRVLASSSAASVYSTFDLPSVMGMFQLKMRILVMHDQLDNGLRVRVLLNHGMQIN